VCRIIELETGGISAAGWTPTTVRAFSVLPAFVHAVVDAFNALAGRHATVVVWDAPNDHRQVVVADTSYERMRREALTALGDAGLPVRSMLADIAPASVPIRGTGRRSVLLASADAASINAALAPLIDAGIRIDSVMTPAGALQSLARARRRIDRPEESAGDEIYVVVDDHVGCAALMRRGAMIAARTLPWGYVDETSGRRLLRPRQEVATRLEDDLAEFVAAAQSEGHGLSHIAVCGALPDLRSMAAQLVERLDVEVEPLDSMFGIEPEGLPTTSETFPDRVAELRLVWAAAADTRPALDLFRAGRTRARRMYLSRAAVAAGVAAGIGIGWMVQARWGPVVRSRPVASTARPATVSRPRPTPPAAKPIVAAAPSRSASAIQPAPPPVALRGGPVPAAASPSVSRPAAPPSRSGPGGFVSSVRPAPEPSSTTPIQGAPSSPAPAPVARGSALPTTPAPAPLPRTNPQSAPQVQPPSPQVRPPATPPVMPAAPPLVVPAPVATSSEPRSDTRPSTVAPARRSAPAEIPLAFEATLGTILYGPDRRLAIIDGRIVGEGDEVRGARIVQITPNAVMLRDAQGRLRRLGP
jgi:hypothetical protein